MGKWLEKEKEKMRKRKKEREVIKEVERKAFKRAKLKGKIDRAKARGYQAGRTSLGDQLINTIAGPPPKQKMPKTRRHKTKSKSRSRSNDIFGDWPIV